MPVRSEYRHFHPVLTRWQDNDVYGHVNNVAYYGYFDTAVNSYLIEQGLPEAGVTAQGFGKSMPVAENDTAAGRQKNRRVEVVCYRWGNK